MSEAKRDLIEKMVYAYAKEIDFKDYNQLESLIDELDKLPEEDIVEKFMTHINYFIDNYMLTEEQLKKQSSTILAISPDKYKNYDDIVKLREAMEKKKLEDNHLNVLETFDEFNKLLYEQYLDCHYTGGLMAYIATNTNLRRLHGDLDIMVNEEDLLVLKKLVDRNPNFTFECNMEGKYQDEGHEFAIRYKDTPVTIGIFLFSRDQDNGIINKSYYYENGELKCLEQHHSPEATGLSYDFKTRSYNDVPYYMLSLESIYASKVASTREKDQYDSNLIKPHIDINKAGIIRQSNNSVSKKRVDVDNGVVKDISTEMMMNKNM